MYAESIALPFKDAASRWQSRTWLECAMNHVYCTLSEAHALVSGNCQYQTQLLLFNPPQTQVLLFNGPPYHSHVHALLPASSCRFGIASIQLLVALEATEDGRLPHVWFGGPTSCFHGNTRKVSINLALLGSPNQKNGCLPLGR